MSMRSHIFIGTRHNPDQCVNRPGKRQMIGLAHSWSYGITFMKAANRLMQMFSSPAFRLGDVAVRDDFMTHAVHVGRAAYSCDFDAGYYHPCWEMDKPFVEDPRLANNEEGIFVIDVTHCWIKGGRPRYAFMRLAENDVADKWMKVPLMKPIGGVEWADIYYGEKHFGSEIYQHNKGTTVITDPEVLRGMRARRDIMKSSFEDHLLMDESELHRWFPKMYDGVDLKRRKDVMARKIKAKSAPADIKPYRLSPAHNRGARSLRI